MKKYKQNISCNKLHSKEEEFVLTTFHDQTSERDQWPALQYSISVFSQWPLNSSYKCT